MILKKIPSAWPMWIGSVIVSVERSAHMQPFLKYGLMWAPFELQKMFSTEWIQPLHCVTDKE
jgi:hypothetical protein